MKPYNQKSLLFIVVYLIACIIHIPGIKAQDGEYEGFLPDKSDYIRVTAAGGVIHKIESVEPQSNTNLKVFIAPGLIDTQVNGYASVSFNDNELTTEKIHHITKAMWKEGVTTFFPTIITNSATLIEQNFKILAESIEDDPELSHSIPGYFLEGPYISPLDGFRGAHQKEWVRLPDWEEFSTFYSAAGGKIIQVGVAPEIDGMMDFMQKCHELGVVISLAHHNATATQVEEAVKLGARVSTHLGNGCANTIHRHDNPIWPQLANEKLTPSIIADGHHLRKEELKVFFKVKGADNLMLVSDATVLAGMPAGTYQWNGKEVVMTEDGMLKFPAQNVLAGASFPIRTGVKNMVQLAGCPLEEAIIMASKTPARVYNLNDRGEIKEGHSADLILFSIDDNELIIQKTVLQGKVVYQKTE